LSTASSDLTFTGGAHTRLLTVRRSALARRMRLAVDPRDGAVKLTLPRRAALAPALKWAESQRAWVERALAKLPAQEALGQGSVIPFEGGDLRIEWHSGTPDARSDPPPAHR